MCQEATKVREEEGLENEIIQSVLKQPLIVRKVLGSLDFPTLLQCREVNKAWEKEASKILSPKCKVTFSSIETVQDFMKLSPRSVEETLFVHVAFKFDIDSEPKVLQTFLERHAKNLSSIETLTGSVCGADSVKDWTNTVLSPMKKSDEEPVAITVDENANYVHATDENGLQEIVINDEVEECKLKQLATPKKSKTVHFSMVENPEYVPLPYSEDGYENFADFYPYYLGEHSNAMGRRMHILGITNSIILIFIGTFTLTPLLFLVAIIQAYALALGAHYYYDKHIPKPTIRNPVYMVMGNLKMWWEVASGQRAL